MQLVELLMKKSIFPIMVENLYNSAYQIWPIHKPGALILFLAGFILTPLGNLILLTLFIFRILKKKEII
ncbi:MAG: hypothetical protein QXF25_01070 [Candidatus Pacearchaeota archaeon]